MIQHTIEEINAFANEVWPDADKITASLRNNYVCIEVKAGDWGYPDVSLPTLMKVARFFNTMNIDESRWKTNGCETCDYGSARYVELHIRDGEPPA